MSRRRKPSSGARAVTLERPVKARRRGTLSARPANAPTPGRDTRSRSHRLAKILVGLGLMVTTVALGGQWVLQQSIFRVQHVTLLGLHHETAGAILAAAGLENHPTMVGVSSGSLEMSLSSFAWIDSVSVSKHWPNSIVVKVHEATPVAVAFDAKHELQFVDARGRDLGPAPLKANYPTLVYLSPKDAIWPYGRAGVAAALVASKLPKAFSAQVSQITVGAAGDVTLKMTTPVSFILGPPTELRAKFVAIASVIAHTTLKPGDVVDVSVPDELAVSGPAPS